MAGHLDKPERKSDSLSAAMKMFIALFVLAFVGGLAPLLASDPFGQPGHGRIAIVIVGAVERPGLYHLDQETAVENLSALVGGLRVCRTCHRGPSVLYVTPRGQPGQKRRYSLSQPELFCGVRLKDGDVVTFATAHF